MIEQRWRLKLYRDDSETTVVVENIKHVFMTAGNTVLTIAQYDNIGGHHYINWPRERLAWWKLERQTARPCGTHLNQAYDSVRAGALAADYEPGSQAG